MRALENLSTSKTNFLLIRLMSASPLYNRMYEMMLMYHVQNCQLEFLLSRLHPSKLKDSDFLCIAVFLNDALNTVQFQNCEFNNKVFPTKRQKRICSPLGFQ